MAKPTFKIGQSVTVIPEYPSLQKTAEGRITAIHPDKSATDGHFYTVVGEVFEYGCDASELVKAKALEGKKPVCPFKVGQKVEFKPWTGGKRVTGTVVDFGSASEFESARGHEWLLFVAGPNGHITSVYDTEVCS